MTSPLKVFIADDETLFRNVIELVIQSEEDMYVIGTAENGLEAVQQIEQLQPDIVLLDIRMPVMDGIESIKNIRSLFPDMIILILTTFNEDEYIIEGLAHGANGYLLKGTDFNKLVQHIRDVFNGQHLLSPEVATKLAKYVFENKISFHKQTLPPIVSSDDLFTAREKEVIAHLLNRLTNKEIAQHLFVSEGTIKNYLTTIYDKLNVKSRHEAIQYLKKSL